MTKRTIPLLAASALSLAALYSFLIAACGRNAESITAEAVRPALVERVAATPGFGADVFSGEIRARHETDLAFRISGKIAAREVETGDAVKPGTVLARLDPDDVKLRFAEAEAQYAPAEAEVKRYRDLRAQNFISQSALDARESAFRAARAQLELARNQQSYAVLRADRAGVVTLVAAEAGQVVAAGQPVMRLALPGEPEVVISIPENRLKAFQSAKRLTVALWSAPGKHYAGRIRELAPAADAATRTFAARISIVDADADVRLGMSASVRLTTDREQQVFVVPQSALTRIDGKPTVWVVDAKAQTVAPRAVTVVEFDANDRVAVADGLNAGDLVVTAGVHKLLPGQKVRPVMAAAEAP
ncbi:MAG: efflux RND transporter periplasmic adaptor subunit [Georgfuchsia sp.]